VEKSLDMGSSSGDGRKFNCDTINVQCKKREVDRKYCSGRVWERVGLERFRSLNRDRLGHGGAVAAEYHG
jgi:hypothetical protein